MGQHYIPQHYLRGFEASEEQGTIWTYNRSSKAFKRIPIKAVAQQAGYFDADVEVELSVSVEGPALAALARLRSRKSIDDDDRARLAVYAASMMMRVPRRRRRTLETVPTVLTDVVAKFRQKLEQWAQSPDANHTLIARRFTELDAAQEKFAAQPPPEVVELVRSPWPRPKYVELVYSMAWRIIVSNRADRFLTSDNPAFFFDAYGLGRAEAEVSFPLGSDVALHASWQGPHGGLMFVEAKPALVRELNRRVASGAERFVFYHQRAPWVPTVAEKANPFLSRILW